MKRSYETRTPLASPVLRIGTAAVVGSLAFCLGGCAFNAPVPEEAQAEVAAAGLALAEQAVVSEVAPQETASASEQAAGAAADIVTTVANTSAYGVIDATDLFTDRDLRQQADLADAVYLSVSDGQTLDITEEGVYVVSGTAANACIRVNADSAAKVQIVLDGVAITNDDFPAIYVLSADKVFVTTTATENTLAVTGAFVADGETNTDAVIFSKDDLVLNGMGSLVVSSTDNGVTCKDDLKVTGGTYVVSSAGDGFEANDSISIASGEFIVSSSKDAFHCENSDDDTVGAIYICGGSFSISAADDGIQGTTAVQIDDGTFEIAATEGIEATYIQINGGTINISASDDGINATYKSASFSTPTIEFTGGDTTVDMGQGDTDAIDANGCIYMSGGTLTISATSAFDYDQYAEMTGGTLVVNGQQMDYIQNSMMGGGMMGGQMGDMGGSMMGGQMGGRGW